MGEAERRERKTRPGRLLSILALLVGVGAILLGVWPRTEWASALRERTAVRQKARQSSCLANIKSLALQTLQYAEDWDGRLPPPSAAATNASLAAGKVRGAPIDLSRFFLPDDWHRLIAYRNSQVFVCPSTRSIYSYDLHQQVCGAEVDKLAHPAETVMEFEKGFLNGAPPGPHHQGYNLTFCDGHAKWAMGPGRTAPGEGLYLETRQ